MKEAVPGNIMSYRALQFFPLLASAPMLTLQFPDTTERIRLVGLRSVGLLERAFVCMRNNKLYPSARKYVL